MAKLTTEQKAQNCAATKRRNKAFYQRKNAYWEKVDAARAAIEASDAALAAAAADTAVQAAIAERDSALADLDAQIKALNDKRAACKAECEARLQPLSEARKTAWNRKRELEQAAEAQVHAEYSDVADCWGPAAWKPLTEFLPT